MQYTQDMVGNTHYVLMSDYPDNTYVYGPFGEEEYVDEYFTNDYRYGGQWGYYRDEADRLYVRARHLKPSQGRWLGRDPVGARPNRYGYVGNSPVTNIDPSGRWVYHILTSNIYLALVATFSGRLRLAALKAFGVNP